MVQSSAGKPYDSAEMEYQLIASKVCLLKVHFLGSFLIV